MQRVIVCLLMLTSYAAAQAQSLQEQVNNAKFQIIKQTVEFLSTDTATFHDAKEHTCSNCGNIDSLKAFIERNNIKKAGGKVVDPLNAIAVDASPTGWNASLKSFAGKADDMVTGGDKAGRKKLDRYKAYQDEVANIIAGVKPSPEEQQVAAKPGKNANDTVNAKRTADTSQTIADKASALLSSPSAWLTWLPLVIALAAIVFLIVKMPQANRDRQGKKHYKDKYDELMTTSQEKDKTITALRKENEGLRKKLTDAEVDYKSLEDRNNALEKESRQQTRTEELSQQDKKPEAPVNPTKLTVPKQPVSTIKYAHYADAGDGFSDSELLDKADNKTIFELTILPNKKSAEFIVSRNTAAQNYALSNTQYFLGKTCQYDTFPAGNATIQTDAPGSLELSGTKWKITRPAKISFV